MNDKIQFPTPLEFGEASPVDDLLPSVSLMTPTKVVEENTLGGKLVYRVGNIGGVNHVV